MQIVLLIPVETRLNLEQTDKANQVCKRHLRIDLHGLCVGPIQTLRSLTQQFAFQPEVLAPQKKKKSFCTTTTELLSGNRIITNNRSYSSIHPARMSSLDLNSKGALHMIQLESRAMIQGKLTGNMGKERTLQEKTPIFWSTAIFHLYCLSPITEQNTCPVLANPPLQVFTQSKASTASKQLSDFKTHLLSSCQTLDLCPKGTIWYCLL